MYKKLLSDFTGGVNLACAPLQLGLDTNKISWAQGLNVEIFAQKGICRCKGNTRLTYTPEDSGINSLFTYTPHADTTQRKILYSTQNGKFYEYDCTTSTHTLLKNDLTPNKPCKYALFIGGVAIANGADEPFFYTIDQNEGVLKGRILPTNTVAKDGTSPIIADTLCAYKNRLWLACDNTLYYSALGTYDDWQTAYDAGYISNFHCDESPITALSTYKDYLAIYKEKQVYLLSGTSADDFAIVPFSNKGATSQGSVVSANNKQYFFSDALFTLEQTGILAQITVGSEASLKIKPVLNNQDAYFTTLKATPFNKNSETNSEEEITYFAGGALDKSRLSLTHAVIYEPQNQIWFYVPTQNNDYINNIWIYDWLNSAWTLRALPQPVLCATPYGDEIICATQDGRILLENLGPDFDGTPIVFEWKSPFMTLGEPNTRKIIDEFYFLISDTLDNNFLFRVYKDYDTLDAQDHEEIQVLNQNNLLWGSKGLKGDLYCWADEEETAAQTVQEPSPVQTPYISGEITTTNNSTNITYEEIEEEIEYRETTVEDNGLGGHWAVPCETAQKAEISGSSFATQICIYGNQPHHNFALLALQYKELMAD